MVEGSRAEIGKKLVAAATDGSDISMQVFIEKYDFTDNEDGTSTGAISTEEFDRVGFSIDPESWIIELSQPALAIKDIEYNSATGETIPVYQPVHVFVTCTIIENDENWHYDTGVRGGLAHGGLDDTGLVISLQRPDLRYDRVGTDTDDWATGESFGTIYFDEPSGEWLTSAPGTAVIINDDTAIMAAICEEIIAANGRRTTDVTAGLRGCIFGTRPGDGLYVRGRGIDNVPLTISSVSLDFSGVSTQVSASDMRQKHIIARRYRKGTL
jgi:hypothetical protein